MLENTTAAVGMGSILGAYRKVDWVKLGPLIGIGINIFAQSVHIKLALPQAEQLSLFYGLISDVAPPWGTWIKDALLRG